MDFIVNYFSAVPDSHRIILLGVCFIVFGNFEILFEFKKVNFKLNHILTNSLFILPAAPVQFLIGILIVKELSFETLNQDGFLNLLNLKSDYFLIFILGFVLLDFCEYVYHVIMHKVKRLWMIHLVHHSDRDLTVSSTLREHPAETTIRLLFLVIWIFLTGVPFWVLLFRQFIQIVSNVFAHSNFRLSERVDKKLSLLFVTPNMHQVHHHYLQPYTDKNYGDVLSIWDRLFGTYTTADKNELEFGVDNYLDKNENTNFFSLLKIPFGKYRSSAKRYSGK